MKSVVVLYICLSLGFPQRIPQGILRHKNFKLLYQGKTCGGSGTNRIVGGKEAALDQYPWVARISYAYHIGNNFNFANQLHCGGTIISDWYVITAAHCGPNHFGKFWNQVILGYHNIKEGLDCEEVECAPPYQVIDIESYYCHEGFNKVTAVNDICILRLKNPIRFHKYVRPICLPFEDIFRNIYYEGMTMEVAGWGYTNYETKVTPTVLMRLKVHVVDRKTCKDTYLQYGGGRVNITHGQLCGGGNVGQDSCTGDSGGPLMEPFSVNGPPRYFLIGIVSLGQKKCGKNPIPGIYTFVPMYIKWILDHLPARNQSLL